MTLVLTARMRADAIWLAHPAEIKPGTFMPNLELTEKEIEALIAYLGTLK